MDKSLKPHIWQMRGAWWCGQVARWADGRPVRVGDLVTREHGTDDPLCCGESPYAAATAYRLVKRGVRVRAAGQVAP